MMTYKEAADRIRKYHCTDDCLSMNRCDVCEISKAITALEQQVPRKPHTETDGDTTTYDCPVCGLEFFRISTMHIKMAPFRPYRPSYCYRCGQRLKWYNE